MAGKPPLSLACRKADDAWLSNPEQSSARSDFAQYGCSSHRSVWGHVQRGRH